MVSFQKCYEVASACIPTAKKRVFLKRLNFAVRFFFIHSSLIELVETFFSENLLRRSIIGIPGFRENIYKQQIRNCFYRDSTSAHRRHFLQSHFVFLEKTHTEESISKIYTDSLPPLVFLEGDNRLSFHISYEKFVEREGLLLLVVKMNDITLYRIYFWLTQYNDLPTLCVGALQGGKNTLEINREFTKEFWGLRPQNLAFTVLRWYAKSMGIQQLYTFPREKLWNSKIVEQTALDEFWQEQGATPVANTPFIKLELNIPHKDISDIPTRKRSMYKKRYDFLDRLGAEIVVQLQPLLKTPE